MSPKTFTRPSAWLPLVMSLAALTTVMGHVAVSGTAHEADEGAAAHIFQFLIAGQVPVIAFFALRWLRRTPRQAVAVLVLQFLVAIVALAPVWYFHL